MSDPWQDNLRNRMEHHEEPAPEGLWEGIDLLIAGSSTGRKNLLKPNHSLRNIYIGALSAAAAVTLLLLLVLRYTSSENQTDTSFTEKTAPVVQQKEQPAAEIPIVEIPVAESSSRLFATQKVKSRPALQPPQLLQEQHNLISTNQNPDSITIKIGKSVVKENDHLLAMNTPQDRRTQSKWQTSLSLSNAPSESSATYSGYGSLAAAETVDQQYDFVPNYTREQAYTDVKHHQPITFGITLRYNVNERWSVASGLTYTQLISELRSGSGNYYYDDRQTLHYIGIPVNIAYTFWQNNKISTYLSTGGLVEKNVSGRLTSNYYLDNQLEVTTQEKIISKELQWSVNGAVGLGYQISNTIGLYAEPGISYYFKNGSELETLYKDNPLHFNLRLGLRITLGD